MIMLQVLSYVAQQEREFIRQRQREGIEAAKRRGVRFGRRRMAIPEGYGEVKAVWGKREISAREAARRLGVSRNTFMKWVRSGE